MKNKINIDDYKFAFYFVPFFFTISIRIIYDGTAYRGLYTVYNGLQARLIGVMLLFASLHVFYEIFKYYKNKKVAFMKILFKSKFFLLFLLLNEFNFISIITQNRILLILTIIAFLPVFIFQFYFMKNLTSSK